MWIIFDRYLQCIQRDGVIADCGGGVVEHALLEAGLAPSTKVTQCLRAEEDLTRLHTAACRAQEVVTDWAKRPASQVSGKQ